MIFLTSSSIDQNLFSVHLYIKKNIEVLKYIFDKEYFKAPHVYIPIYISGLIYSFRIILTVIKKSKDKMVIEQGKEIRHI